MKKLFYRVAKTDDLNSVSKKFGLPVCKIIALNQLCNEIEEGDLLFLEIDENKRVYCVQPTDTLEGLAKKFDTTGESILIENGIDNIYFGEEIIIP